MLKDFINAHPEILELSHTWENESKIKFNKQKDSGFDVSVEETASSISIETNTGFHDNFEVRSFESKDQALSQVFGLVRDLLTSNMRIRVVLKNNKPIKWVLEYFEDNKWQEESTMGLLTLNIFGKKTEQIFLNDILPPRTFID